MCIGSPAVIVDIDEENMMAKIDFGDGIHREAIIGVASEKLSVGDIVMIHAGVIISRFDEEGILEQIKFLEELLGEDGRGMINMYENLMKIARSLKGMIER
ncbi:MAG: HypC/HybG/HupF family hydrogenase formation chaperone [Candidatus Methanomethylicia archaeon]